MPNAIDLTWLQAVKNRAEVQNDSDDGDIQAAITAFSQWMLTFSGVSTLNSLASLDEIYDGNGNTSLMLRSTPARSIVSVTMNGANVPISTAWNIWGVYIGSPPVSLGIRPGGAGGGILSPTFPFPYPTRARFHKWPCFMHGKGNIEAVYQAGYEPLSISNEVQTVTDQTITLDRGPWAGDLGVTYYPSLAPLESVANSPIAGQYAVSNGLYVFALADEGSAVAVSYTVNAAPADLEYAIRCIVAINYKRKAWQDQKSRVVSAQGGGAATTSYRDWEMPPEYWRILLSYQRKSFS